jgi:hypothetical protein
MRESVLDFHKHEVYEAGAILATLLAYPGLNDTDATRGRLHRTLCGLTLHDRCETDPEWAAAPQRIKPIYTSFSEQAIKRARRTLERRLRDRMAAARMVIPFLKQAQDGQTPDLPPGVKRLSLNQMAGLVGEDVGQSDPQNVKTRIWRPSVPVIHLAAATAVLGQGISRGTAQSLHFSHLVRTQWVIEWIVRQAEEFETLIEKSQRRLHIDRDSLIRVRLA